MQSSVQWGVAQLNQLEQFRNGKTCQRTIAALVSQSLTLSNFTAGVMPRRKRKPYKTSAGGDQFYCHSSLDLTQRKRITASKLSPPLSETIQAGQAQVAADFAQ